MWKDTIIYTEELLLETLCFDLSVEHPYHFLLNLFSHYQKDSQRKEYHTTRRNRCTG